LDVNNKGAKTRGKSQETAGFGEMASIALFSAFAFASSLFDCGGLKPRKAAPSENQKAESRKQE